MNRSITLTLPHSLSQPEARRRVVEALGELERHAAQAKLGSFQHGWQGERASFVAHALGQEVSGHVEVLANSVAMEVTLPAFLAFVANAVRGRLQAEGHKLLSKDAGR